MTRALIVAAAVLAASAAPVDAHRLSIVRAAHKAHSEALIISGKLPQRSRISVRSCVRTQRHLVDCRVRYRFVDEHGELTGQRCYQTIRVRFVSNTTYRLTVSFPPSSVRC